MLYQTLLAASTQTLKSELAEVRREMGQMIGSVRQSQVQTEMQQAVQGVDPTVAKEAQKLYVEWQKAGLQGWKPADAVIYAKGQLALANEAVARRQQPNGQGEQQYGASAPNPVVQTRLPPPKSDAEVNKMSLAQQEAYWAGRVGDSPIQY